MCCNNEHTPATEVGMNRQLGRPASIPNKGVPAAVARHPLPDQTCKMTREMIPSAWNDPRPSPETKVEGQRNKKGRRRIKNKK
jgi:hypothetical protein